jgi:hypothetical protein
MPFWKRILNGGEEVTSLELIHCIDIFTVLFGWLTSLLKLRSQLNQLVKLPLIDYRSTIASVVIQAIGSGTNEETLMKATHPVIRLGQFGACTKLVSAIGHCLHILVDHKSH